MSSQIPNSFISSPRKRGSKKSKCHLSNGNETCTAKAQRVKGDHVTASEKLAAMEHCDKSQTAQGPRRSAREGTGSGGRTQQLKKLGAIFEDRPMRGRHSRSTDLPVDVAPNPLAPLVKRSRSGQRATGKKPGLDMSCPGPPPPYVPEVDTTPVLVFYQRSSESDWFGFSASTPQTHIVPPGTEPNLQALNNSYIAAREEQARLRSLQSPELAQRSLSAGPKSSPHLVLSHNAESTSVPALNHRDPLPSRNLSTSFQVPHVQAIDPTLLSTSVRPQHSSDSFATRRSGTQPIGRADRNDNLDERPSENEETSNDTEKSDDTEDEHGEGWGATNSRQATHPGFSKESHPSNSVHHVSLPPEPEFDFQFSRDEDDNSAHHNLGHTDTQAQRGDTGDVSDGGGFTQLGDPVNVLNHHHQVNGSPLAPDPWSLTVQPACTRAP
ncbi:hypothetical protein JVU11DRAFT_6268 [Chiua virens]|nr:hypothetical protein JVU11DRAFT_6268 [Chiua virens]